MCIRRIFEMALHLCLCYLCLKVSEPWDFQDQTYWSFSAWNSLFCWLSWSLWDSSTSREQMIAGRKWKVKIVDPLERKHYQKTLSLQCPGESLTHFWGGGGTLFVPWLILWYKSLVNSWEPRQKCLQHWGKTMKNYYFIVVFSWETCLVHALRILWGKWSLTGAPVCFPVSMLLKACICFCLIIYFMFFPRSRK